MGRKGRPRKWLNLQIDLRNGEVYIYGNRLSESKEDEIKELLMNMGFLKWIQLKEWSRV